MISDILTALQKYLACMLQGATNKPITVTLAPVSRDKEAPLGSLVITLLRIEEETSRKPQNLYAVKKDILHPKSPDVDVNLEILISSPAEPYETALQLISNVIRAINSIKTINQPEGLSDEDFKTVQSYNISLMGLSLDQTLSLWQTLGGTLVPSVVYKVRMLTMEGVLDASELHLVRYVDVETRHANEMDQVKTSEPEPELGPASMPPGNEEVEIDEEEWGSIIVKDVEEVKEAEEVKENKKKKKTSKKEK